MTVHRRFGRFVKKFANVVSKTLLDDKLKLFLWKDKTVKNT